MPESAAAVFGASCWLCTHCGVYTYLAGTKVDASALDQITLVNDFVVTDVLSRAIPQITVPDGSVV